MLDEGQKLFYRTVFAVGAQLAMADGNPNSRELDQLKRLFSLKIDDLPDAATIYNGELHKPRPLWLIFEPIKEKMRSAPEMAESFLYGMCLVAMSDNTKHKNELALLENISVLIGLPTTAKDRVFLASGIKEAAQGKPETKTASSEREKHLRILGLLSNATQEQIADEYKRLVKRYHPDVLRSQGLPDAEIRHAEGLLAQLNRSYDWLRSNS